jgi:hypothetical protein
MQKEGVADMERRFIPDGKIPLIKLLPDVGALVDELFQQLTKTPAGVFIQCNLGWF